MKFTRELITPEVAKMLLSRLDLWQRSMKPANLKRFEAALRRGEFQLTHQGIAISVDDTLLDGMHRLQAIINTGVSAYMIVCRGVPRERIAEMDGGVLRSDLDRLGASRDQVAIAHSLARFGRKWSTVTTGMKGEVIASVGGLVDELLRFAPSKKRLLTIAPIYAGVIMNMTIQSRKAYAMEQFRHVSLLNNHAFSKQVSEFVNQATRGIRDKARLSHDELFVRSWLAFDATRAEKHALVVKNLDETRKKLLAEVKLVIPALASAFGEE